MSKWTIVGTAGVVCTGAEVHPAGLPNVRVNIPHARRQWERVLFPCLKECLSCLRRKRLKEVLCYPSLNRPMEHRHDGILN